MSLLNKLTIHNLKLNKKRTIVTIVGIMLSVALITAVASVYASGLQSLINYETNEKGMFHVAFFDVPVEEVKILENNRSVETVNLTESIGYAIIDSKNESKPYVCVKGFTKDSLENLSVKLVDGRFPENDGEVLIPTHLKTNGRVTLAVGDEVTLDVGKRVSTDGYELNQHNPLTPTDENGTPMETIDTPNAKTYKIVGIMERPAGNVEPFSAPGYTVITRSEKTGLSGNVDVYVRLTKEGTKNAYRICAGILGVDEKLFEKSYGGGRLTQDEIQQLGNEMAKSPFGTIDFNSYLITLETNPLGISTVSTLAYAVLIVIAIIVATSVFCIKNSFDISITEKIRQYGMLRSIGATKKQIRKNVFFEATLLGAFGIPLGILLGFLASYILIIISNLLVADMFGSGFSLSFVFSWWAVASAVLLGGVTIYFSAFRSAVKAAKVSPLDSVRNSADIKVKCKKLSSPKIIRRLFGMGGEISYKNLKRNRSKYRTTVISIVVSVVVFISLSAFMSMAFDEVDREIERTDYNISVSATYADSEEYQKLLDTVSFDHVQDFSVVRTAEIEFIGNHYNKEYSDWIQLMPDENGPQYISVASVGDKQFAKYCASLGLDSQSMKGKAVLCDYSTVKKYSETGDQTNRYMRIFDFEKGDLISGFTENALTENKIDAQVEVAAISERKPFGLKNWSSAYLFVNDELFDHIAETTWVNIVYKTDNSDKLQDEIESHLQGISFNLNNSDEHFREMNNLFTLVGIFLYGFIIVISLIGITNIFNTITTNMELRKPEFAMLRSVGMTNKEFNRMIRLESLFMGARALVFGIPIGILLSYAIYHFLTEESGDPYKLPALAILIAIVTVFVLISLIMAYSMGKIKKQNTIETIRNENI